MNIKRFIIVFFMISIIGSMVVACSKKSTKMDAMKLSYEEVNLFELDVDNFINDIATLVNSEPEDLILSIDSSPTKIIFDADGAIEVLKLRFIDASKEPKSLYTLNLDYLLDKKGTKKNIYIKQDEADSVEQEKTDLAQQDEAEASLEGDTYLAPQDEVELAMQAAADPESTIKNIKLTNFIKSIQRAAWKEIFDNMKPSEYYGFKLSTDKIVTIMSFENTKFTKYHINELGETIKLMENELVYVNGITFSAFIENIELNDYGFKSLGSETAVIFEIDE